MITAARMAAVDANAAALGVPRRQLMESSGNAVARVVRDVAEPGSTVLVVAGRGNNGGDAYVAVRFLEPYDVAVGLVGHPNRISTDIARANWDVLVEAEQDLETWPDSTAIALPDADVVVDAVLGTGIAGAPREPEATAIRAMNAHGGTVVSVDVPSGLDADTGVPTGAGERGSTGAGDGGPVVDADHVVTFHDEKPGLADLEASVTVADIGIPAVAETFVGPGDRLGLARDPDSHKGDNGEVLVIGGGPYTGAPALAARAALRAGADLSRVAVPASIAETVQGYAEDLIAKPLDGDRVAPAHVEYLLDLAARSHVVVLGPGLGDHEETRTAVREFLEAFSGTAVVDADALAVVPEVETPATLVCTPHQGELREMGGPSAEDWRERADAVESYAAELGQVLLVKGRYDVISDGGTTRVNRTGTAGMTVGGTGDVLAGATAAMVHALGPSQGAAVGAYANGLAGEAAHGYRADGLVATDLLDELPPVIWGEADA